MNHINLELILEKAIHERDALLVRLPELSIFQSEIDSRISENKNLNDKFLSLAEVYFNYRSLLLEDGK